MAERPIYIPQDPSSFFVLKEKITFDWYGGFALSQKQKTIRAFHLAAEETFSRDGRFSALNPFKPLEVSSKSENPLGVALSAFNLKFNDNGEEFPVENIFQSAKVFEKGGPFIDLRGVSPKEAKGDPRLKESGALQSFKLGNTEWPLEPKTFFYDWIYLNALHKHQELAKEVRKYNAFTDIEFNPKKSINCQACSVALYVALTNAGEFEKVMSDVEEFKKILSQIQANSKSEPESKSKIEQMSLF